MDGALLDADRVDQDDSPPPEAAANPFATRHDGSLYEYDGSLQPHDFDQLLLWAGERKASDVRITTDREVMAEIGADIVPVTRRLISQAEIENLVRYIYGEHGPGQIKSGYDLDPAHEVRMGRSGIRRYRINVTAIRIPGGDGMQITCRTLPTSPPDIKVLGIEDEILANLRPREGLVLVTGPTGSGKSTLLASMIRRIVEAPDANETVLEFSSPIEYVYDEVDMPSASVAQTEVGRHLRPRDEADRRNETSLFAYATRNALRRKPTIVLVGEARDRPTIQGVVELALTGHLVYSTMHVIGVAEALRRAIQPFPGDEREAMAVDIMQSLRMVVTQLLFPRVGGGRVACREYAIFDSQVRGKFLNKPVDQWPAFARRLMEERSIPSRRMSESAWDLYRKGLLSAVDYKKIVSAQRDSA